ncbi:hypothetical protein JK635_20495 [Neobacillus sp. YIM B02564]|uniref:Uncharacterized protein n=1 Tax=Neobacillus paridis TaxID=2803862 RepID=A0ABS1TXA8_9BACI|nr:hypothetical protein [Neobacillus paridis]
MSVKIEDSWYEFKNTLIPEDAVWNSEKQEIEVPDAASRDLLKLGASVSAGQAISGHLMFISSDVPLSAISNSKPHDFKMNVTDVLGTTFEVAIAPPRPGSIGPARRLNVYASNKAKSGP